MYNELLQNNMNIFLWIRKNILSLSLSLAARKLCLDILCKKNNRLGIVKKITSIRSRIRLLSVNA